MADGMTAPQGGLISALCAAQAQFRAVEKSKKGARSMYAPLEDVLAMVRPVLASRGLAITQTTYVKDDWLMLLTALRYTDGDFLTGDYPVCAIGKPPQEIGSALTYARRYALLAICGIQPGDEDDDGEHATQQARKEPQPERRAAPAARPDDSKLKVFVNTVIGDIAKVATMDELEAYTDKLFATGAWRKLMAEHGDYAARVQNTIAAKTDALVEAAEREPA